MIFGLVSCRTPYGVDARLTDADLAPAEALARVHDATHSANTNVVDGLQRSHRRARVFPGTCGYERSTIRPFKVGATVPPTAWFDESGAWRAMARPKGNGACLYGETEAQGTCEKEYGMQFFPNVKSRGGADYMIVSGVSPIIRVLERESYPVPTEACVFRGDSALMLVMGVRNPGLGTAWDLIDQELLATAIAWNRNPSAPGSFASHQPSIEKLSRLPSYIQIVDNKLSALEGARGLHEEAAIKKVLANLELAYKAGVNQMEIIAHSNGSTTVFVALRLFVEKLETNQATWSASRNEIAGAARKMRVRVVHNQAAPARKWSFAALDSFESFTDFFPNARWVWRGGLVGYWGWEWDFSVYQKIERHLDLRMGYLYNRPDWMTYDPFLTSPVGRRESLAWLGELNVQYEGRGRSFVVSHFACADESVEVCGPEHDQKNTLWSFATPGSSMPWELEMSTHTFGTEPSADMEAAPIPLAMRALGFDGSDRTVLPEVYCVDADTTPGLCNMRGRDRGAGVHQEGGILSLPSIACTSADDVTSPCQTSACGDGICAIQERNHCQSDCNLPSTFRTCQCGDGTCMEQVITCNANTGCKSTYASAGGDSCACSGRGFPYIKCSKGDEYCEVTSAPGPTCRLSRTRTVAPGRLESITCEGAECVDVLRNASREGFQLAPDPKRSRLVIENP